MSSYLPTIILLSLCLFILLISCASPPFTPSEPSDIVDHYAPEAYFARSVVDYQLAPGQFVNHSDLSLSENFEAVLGPPDAYPGSEAQGRGSVSLGMAGGSVTVLFDPPITNHPQNIGSYDFIVFGNALGRPAESLAAWREPGLIEVMKDENRNRLADDKWYVIAGTDFSNALWAQTICYSKTNAKQLPENKDYFPLASSNDDLVFEVALLSAPLYGSVVAQNTFGYADVYPVLLPGDTDGDGLSDHPDLPFHHFYTFPHFQQNPNMTQGSGGGDAIKLEWAVDPDAGFAEVQLESIDFIRVTSTSTNANALLGEYSTEIDAFARVHRE